MRRTIRKITSPLTAVKPIELTEEELLHVTGAAASSAAPAPGHHAGHTGGHTGGHTTTHHAGHTGGAPHHH